MQEHISKELRQQACQVDLAEWLLTYHPDDVTYKYGSVLLNEDDHISVKANADYHGYMDFHTGETGNNIDYLMRFLGYTYPDAIHVLVEDDDYECITNSDYKLTKREKVTPIVAKDFQLPEQADTYRNLFAFLMNRGIPADTIRMLIDRKLIYQSAPYNNIVFVTPERDFYEVRGTNTYADKRCRFRDECEDYVPLEHGWCTNTGDCPLYKPHPFHGCEGLTRNQYWYLLNTEEDEKVQKVYICESAIDAISLYVMHDQHGIREPAAYVSIAGAKKQGAIDRLKAQHANVIIATDNDKAGDECRDKNKELETIRPIYKDWNEDLQKGAFYKTGCKLLPKK